MSDLLHNSPLVTNLIGIQSKIRILRYEYKTGGLKFKTHFQIVVLFIDIS